MKTIFVNEKEQKRDWYVIDAAGKPLGRVAAKAAYIARGKNKATYTPNQEMGDYVVIINADKVAVSGGKETKKIYYKYTTGFVGSLKANSFEKVIEKHPEDPIRLAVKGMLPHGRLGRVLMQNVKIYAGTDHPHTAQNPKAVEL
ncbi:MAG: 50S ribosomal protein L13 [Treponema sp.]|jgi:large subunit ribosomal protein L13|nr:50S ribosomal protein L13 [Treponema sp.]MBQ5999839.1 50S ribosomal protein L13 [Treponema sp.]